MRTITSSINTSILVTTLLFLPTMTLYADTRILENQKTYVCTPTRTALLELDSTAKVTSQKEIPLSSNVKSFNVKRSDNKLSQWYPPYGSPSGSQPNGDGAIFLSAVVEDGVASEKYKKTTSDSYTLESYIKHDDNTIIAVSQYTNGNHPRVLVSASTCK